jgi:hypothetical protein
MDKIGFNITGLDNLTAPTFDAPTSSADFLGKATIRINELTGGYFGLIVLSTLFIYLWWILADRTEYGDFRYSLTRSLGIASMICGIMGYFMVSFGYFSEFSHVGVFLGLGMITTVWVYLEEKGR